MQGNMTDDPEIIAQFMPVQTKINSETGETEVTLWRCSFVDPDLGTFEGDGKVPSEALQQAEDKWRKCILDELANLNIEHAKEWV